jgi:hypothetical protein
MTGPTEICFLADQMLGKLARLLRLLGYDTLYEPGARLDRIRELAAGSDRVLLTRGRAEERFPGVANCLSLESEDAGEQVRAVVSRFRLDTESGRFTRCTLCNALLKPVEKASLHDRIPPKVWEVYSEFLECSGCGHIYWQGSHVERILRNLKTVLKQ